MRRSPRCYPWLEMIAMVQKRGRIGMENYIAVVRRKRKRVFLGKIH